MSNSQYKKGKSQVSLSLLKSIESRQFLTGSPFFFFLCNIYKRVKNDDCFFAVFSKGTKSIIVMQLVSKIY